MRPKAVMKVGEMATPLTKTARASTATDELANSSGTAVTASTLTAISSCSGN